MTAPIMLREKEENTASLQEERKSDFRAMASDW